MRKDKKRRRRKEEKNRKEKINNIIWISRTEKSAPRHLLTYFK